MTLGSLFSGIGGIDLGFERAGFKVAWQVEIDPYCQKVLARHFPGAKRRGDIRECNAGNLERVDVIAGGDPCQRNSNAGRNGGGAESPAGEFIRVVSELRPRIVLRENPSVVRSDAPWPWWRFRKELESLGYAVLPARLRACCLGLDHRRERLFLLAALPDSDCSRLERHEREELAGAGLRRQDAYAAGSDRWHPAPRICGRADGISNRMDRLKGLGNAVTPAVAWLIANHILSVTA